MTTANAEILVSIINYKTAELTINCLTSLAGERARDSRLSVIVVDSDSRDGSADRIVDAIRGNGWSEWARVISLDRNSGYSAGNNTAIRYGLSSKSPAQYFLLLNPDTIVRPGAIASLLQFMANHPQAGIVGSRLENLDGSGQYTAHQIPTIWHEFDLSAGCGLFRRVLCAPQISLSPTLAQPSECGWVSGASLMIRREVFAHTGFLDEGYFLYFDEVDFCRRAKQTGWSVWYVPTARIVHLGGQATKIYERTKRRGRYWYDSRRRYFLKTHGMTGLLLADLLWAMGRPVFHIRRVVTRSTADPGPKWFAYDLLVGDLAALLRGCAIGISHQ